jgi:LmbE family N-acetylglucosaminyl deacetylase
MLPLGLKFAAFSLLACAIPVAAQPNLSGAAEARLALGRLNTLGSLMLIGAHPDDEQSATLAYLARGRAIRTAYLSLTRGEGGQNLIGPEQGALLGLIRTEELLAARRIDGAEQYFTRAIDFGFTKSADETFQRWGRDAVLADIVWNIRRFRPDVIAVSFSGTPRDGHGHHQASGILGREAYAAAADPKRFPEQLKWVEPWQARRLVWNAFGQASGAAPVTLDTGEFNAVLGHSYGEIAGMSRSMHRTQAMGSAERRGSVTTTLVTLSGEPTAKDLFDGIDTTWNRVPGGAEAGRVLADAARSFDDNNPEKTIPALLEARARLASFKDFWASRKRGEIEETIALCAGLWLDATAERWDAVPGSQTEITLTALERLRTPVRLMEVEAAGQRITVDADLPYNRAETRSVAWQVPAGAAYSQPYWLVEPPRGDLYTVPDQKLIGTPENAPVVSARFRVRVGGQEFDLVRPVQQRYVDRSRGELLRPVAIVPAVAVRFAEDVTMFPDERARTLDVVLRSARPGQAGKLELQAPAGWKVEPAVRDFQMKDAGEETTVSFSVTPPGASANAPLRAVAHLGSGAGSGAGIEVIAYTHIPPQTVFPPAETKLVRTDVRVLAKRVGYVMGAGDEIPQALRQLGCEVTLLGAGDLASGNLAPYDAIVTGVRAWNVRPDLAANRARLMEYVNGGGTLVVQYNTVDNNPALAGIGPYPMRLSRDRVTEEDAPVTLTDPSSPLLQAPNRITGADFDGWIQERGLYFATEWDPRYRTLMESHDPGEAPLAGGTLYTRYGQGAYVFTAWSWFRELPAGVPGAWRIFANLLSAGKVLR